MIPKTIHYCWLGSKYMPELALKCIDSWKRFCPDYEIIMWNEDNYDFTKNKYMHQALQAKKWGFVPDYARLDIVYEHGGIYLDTDVELVKPLDPLLSNHFYAGLSKPPFEVVALGLGFGAEAGHPLLKELMDDYDNYSFYDDKDNINLTPSPFIQTNYLSKHYNLGVSNSIQHLKNNVTIYPKEYFDPPLVNGTRLISENTYSIHHYMASWVPWYHNLFSKLHLISNRVLPDNATQFLVKIRHILFH